jgi:site-specific DNA-cytosine methylase
VNLTYVDCQGYAGAFALGARQAGFQLVSKIEDLKGFGIPAFEANRHVFGDTFTTQARPHEEWEPHPVSLVIGNPPCSGFSGLNTVRGTVRSRGAGSQINDCMWRLFEYAAKCRPSMVIMESVQAAFTQGAELMRALVAALNDSTSLRYQTTHVLQNNLSVGGVSDRPRYFLVASQEPFGVEKYPLSHVPMLRDAITDLAVLPVQWEPQKIADISGITWWARKMHTPSMMVDGHMTMVNAHYRRLMDLVTGMHQVPWHEGEIELEVLRRYWDTFATLPESWDYESRPRDGQPAPRSEVIIKRDFQPAGFSSVLAWNLDRPARVLTGAGPQQWFNALAQRMPTHRECARLMGYPDWWRIEPMQNVRSLGAYWGKQTSVHPATWICKWAASSMTGQPGSIQGDRLPDGSRLINVTHDWKPVWKRQQFKELTLP